MGHVARRVAAPVVSCCCAQCHNPPFTIQKLYRDTPLWPGRTHACCRSPLSAGRLCRERCWPCRRALLRSPMPLLGRITPLGARPVLLCHDTICCIVTQHKKWAVAHSTSTAPLFFFFTSSSRAKNIYFNFFFYFTYCKTNKKKKKFPQHFFFIPPIASLLLLRCSSLTLQTTKIYKLAVYIYFTM